MEIERATVIFTSQNGKERIEVEVISKDDKIICVNRYNGDKTTFHAQLAIHFINSLKSPN